MSMTSIAASSARTATGQSSAQSPPEGRDIDILVSVTAVSGTTPTLDLTVEWSQDGSTWCSGEPVDSIAQITAAKNVVKRFTAKAPQFRLVWTIAGTTPSFTFRADYHVPYGYGGLTGP